MKSKQLLISLIGCLPTLVLAQATPNMMGTWTAASTSAVIGSAMHHIVPNKKDNDIIKYMFFKNQSCFDGLDAESKEEVYVFISQLKFVIYDINLLD